MTFASTRAAYFKMEQEKWLLQAVRAIPIECPETKTKVITVLWPIKKDTDDPVNQSKLKVVTCCRHNAQENVHVQAMIGFDFTSDWLTKWRENFEPITEWSNAKPMQFANYFRHSIENRSIHCNSIKSVTDSWLALLLENFWCQVLPLKIIDIVLIKNI